MAGHAQRPRRSRRVLRNAPNGTTADCRRDLGGGGEPEKADGTPKAPDEKWPDTRNVRADLDRSYGTRLTGPQQIAAATSAEVASRRRPTERPRHPTKNGRTRATSAPI